MTQTGHFYAQAILLLSPAVQRFFDAYRTDNALGVRAYLTTPGVQDQWLSQGLERALQNQSEKALEMLCAHKDKHTTTADPKWWSDFMENVFSPDIPFAICCPPPPTSRVFSPIAPLPPICKKIAPTIAQEVTRRGTSLARPCAARAGAAPAQEKSPAARAAGLFDWWWDGTPHQTTIESTESKRCGLLRTGSKSLPVRPSAMDDQAGFSL